MCGDGFQDLPVLLVGFRDRAEELDEISNCADHRLGRDDLADRFTTAFDNELLAAVAHPIDQIREGTRRLGGRNVCFYII